MLGLIFYILFSLASVGALAFLLHRLGNSKRHIFADEAQVKATFLQEYPDTEIEEIILAVDETAALLKLGVSAHFGLVRAMGRFVTVKIFTADRIANIQKSGSDLGLHFRDFADPDFRITLPDDTMTTRWHKLLKGGPDA